jgi:hypothetical protein
MDIVEKRLNSKDIEEKDFQISSVIKKSCGEFNIVNELKIINGNIYVYLIDETIKVYDPKLLKEIATLKFPFKTKLLKITEENTIVALLDRKLYFYSFNLKENKLKFLLFLKEIFHFCYLKKKKEIIVLTENTTKEGTTGLGRTDLFGNILYVNKQKIKTFYIYEDPKPYQEDIFMMSSRAPIYFSNFDGLNNDKYIINIYGYTDNWWHMEYGEPKDENYTINIFNSDDLNLIFDKNYQLDFRYKKITDNLFKKLYDDEKIFYYHEEKNKIKFINSIIKGEYFYLKDDMFSVITENKILYIVGLSENYMTKKINIYYPYNQNYEIDDIKHLCYFYSNGKSNLYYIVDGFYENNDKYVTESKIVCGYIL